MPLPRHRPKDITFGRRAALQNFDPAYRRFGSKAATPIGPEPEPMSAPLPKATLIQRIRHPVPDALAIAEQVEV